MIHTIDLNFLEVAGAIAAFVIPTDKGGILVETGPYSTHETLLAAVNKMGLQPADIHAVLLTHIHFDHAGAAWWWARQGATVYVHPAGYKHLQNPERLWNSAARIYGDDMDRLWGEMHPIDPEKLIAVADRENLQLDGVTVTAHHTPGHAKHHIAWQVGEELLTGDVGGVKIGSGPVVPPCPPPDIDLPAWETSIARIREIAPRRLYLTHFGPVENTEGHLRELETRLEKVCRLDRTPRQSRTRPGTDHPRLRGIRGRGPERGRRNGRGPAGGLPGGQPALDERGGLGTLLETNDAGQLIRHRPIGNQLSVSDPRNDGFGGLPVGRCCARYGYRRPPSRHLTLGGSWRGHYSNESRTT